MYSLLIVEDEALERTALKHLIENTFPEIATIWEAENGISALQAVQQYQPDILLVDINIPGLSGLALIKTLIEYHYEGKILITTAYDRFNYIKEALELGVIGYLLKPIQDNELVHSLHKCFNLIEEEFREARLKEGLNMRIKSVRFYAQSYLINDMLSGNFPENVLCKAYSWPPNGQLQANVLHWKFPEEISLVEQNAFILDCQEVFLSDFLLISTFVEGEAVIIIQSLKVKEENYLRLAVWVYCMTVLRKLWYRNHNCGRITVSIICHNFKELQQALHTKVSQNQRSNLYSSWKGMLRLEEVGTSFLSTQKSWKKKRQRLVQFLREGHHNRIISMVRRLTEKTDNIWADIFLFLEAILQYDEHVDLCGVFKAITEDISLVYLSSWLREYFNNGIPPQNQEAPEMKHFDNSVQTAMAIIRARFHSDLSQAEVAEELGLSQAYFSRLFKKVVGCNFVEAITTIRIENAKNLLQDSKKSIDEIANQCGFRNKKYFLDVFKKKTGFTTTQYRNLQRGNISCSKEK